MRFVMEMFGETQVDRTLTRLIDAATDARPAWDEIADRFASIEEQQFSSEGRAGSGGWAPLSSAYAQWKARHYPGKPILERSGSLRDSLTRRPFPIEKIDRLDMTIGSDSEYGRYHQAGTERMPQRKPVDLTEYQRRDLVKIMQAHVFGNRGRGVA